MKYLKVFESSTFKKGDYLILEQQDNKKLLIKIGYKIRESNAYDDTCFYGYTICDFDSGVTDLENYIYYNYKLNYFFFMINKPLKMLWKGKDEKEAIKMFEILKNTNKYNL